MKKLNQNENWKSKKQKVKNKIQKVWKKNKKVKNKIQKG